MATKAESVNALLLRSSRHLLCLVATSGIFLNVVVGFS